MRKNVRLHGLHGMEQKSSECWRYHKHQLQTWNSKKERRIQSVKQSKISLQLAGHSEVNSFSHLNLFVKLMKGHGWRDMTILAKLVTVLQQEDTRARGWPHGTHGRCGVWAKPCKQ